MQPPIYVINLDRSPQRLALMTEQLGALGLAFQRVEAVDGGALTDAEFEAHRAAWRRAGRHYAAPKRGEIGAFLSHRRAWRIIAESDSPFGLVLEDDIGLSPNLPQLLPVIADALEPHEMADLGGRRGWFPLERRPLASGYRLVRYSTPALGMLGKLIGREAARALLRATDPCEAPVDTTLQRRRLHGVPMWTMEPGLVRHADAEVGGSTLGAAASGGNRLRRELLRPLFRIGVMADNLRYRGPAKGQDLPR